MRKVAFTLNVEGEKSLMEPIEKKIAIKDDTKNKILQILCNDKGQLVKTAVRYAKCVIVEAMKHMKSKQDTLQKEFMLLFA